jgi:hypothetical protein
MSGLIRAALNNASAVTVPALRLAVIGLLLLTAGMIPVDILPMFNSPAVQVLTFDSGMPASSIEKDIPTAGSAGSAVKGYHAPIWIPGDGRSVGAAVSYAS